MLRGHFGSNLSADMLHQNRRSPGRSINMFDFVLKGANASQLEKDIGSDLFPANEHFFGLVNVSIIQLIFKTARPRRLLNPGFHIILLPKSFFENF